MTSPANYEPLPLSASVSDREWTHVDRGQSRSDETSAIEVQQTPSNIDVDQWRAEIERHRVNEAQQAKILKDLDSIWQKKVAKLEAEVHTAKAEASDLDREIRTLKRKKPREVPPGPRSLLFVDSIWFTIISSCIILVNIVTMVIEMLDTEYKSVFFWPNQLFMVFYIVELGLRGALHRKGLLIGRPCSEVWWNWLDLIVVVSGILEMYVEPILLSFPGMSGGNIREMMKYFRMLRLLRLLRIVKVSRVFFEASFAWTEGERFQLFIMSVIAANSALLGVESDIEDWGGFFYVEQLLLMIFTFELAVRLKRGRLHFFYHSSDWPWNWLDFIIVVGGIVDQWMMPAVSLVRHLMGQHVVHEGHMGLAMSMLRMARLLRILRLMRLIKSIQPLYKLAVGIMQAMQGMMWVMCLTIVVLYAFALLGVRLIRDGLIFDGVVPLDVQQIFVSVPDSIWVFFMMMNGDAGALQPLFAVKPSMKYFAMFFMVLSAWAILSILTAVVSEKMIEVASNTRDEEEGADRKRKLEEQEAKLLAIFQESDVTCEGTLSREEFDLLLQNQQRCEEICSLTGLEQRDLKDLFDTLSEEHEFPDGQCSNVIKPLRFVEGLKNQADPVTQRSIMKLEKQILDLKRHTARHHLQHQKSSSVFSNLSLGTEPRLCDKPISWKRTETM